MKKLLNINIFSPIQVWTPKRQGEMVMPPTQGREFFINHVETEHANTIYDDNGDDIYYINH